MISNKEIKAVPFQPVDDLVMVRPEKAEKSKGGIVLPDSKELKFDIGRVEEVGPGAYQNGVRCPVQVQRGDRVLIEKTRALEITLNDETVWLIKPGSIVGVLSEATKIDLRLAN